MCNEISPAEEHHGSAVFKQELCAVRCTHVKDMALVIQALRPFAVA
jgi:hypothetical protein